MQKNKEKCIIQRETRCALFPLENRATSDCLPENSERNHTRTDETKPPDEPTALFFW
jgi:hypothetical protein